MIRMIDGMCAVHISPHLPVHRSLKLDFCHVTSVHCICPRHLSSARATGSTKWAPTCHVVPATCCAPDDDDDNDDETPDARCAESPVMSLLSTRSCQHLWLMFE
ncbi:uncharacterized protein LOC111603961 isoform X2 [Drosophila hydei]|uniref:Uncharacterized protein LOC111603961 isoform X2 n=1 Tax=Drosophila hydei TaxID=7224 RepID=A0A6J1MKJ7_DROHY|nr:uncharacterized protein LOC111603961 isoform X2 [Drosophila hydei]